MSDSRDAFDLLHDYESQIRRILDSLRVCTDEIQRLRAENIELKKVHVVTTANLAENLNRHAEDLIEENTRLCEKNAELKKKLVKPTYAQCREIWYRHRENCSANPEQSWDVCFQEAISHVLNLHDEEEVLGTCACGVDHMEESRKEGSNE